MTALSNFWDAIPSAWTVKRNRFVFLERNERGRETLPLAAVSQKHGVLDKRELEAIEGRRLAVENDDLSKYKRIAPGDIVYNKMRMWQGAVGVSSINAVVSPAYVVASPFDGVSSRFMGYLLKSEPYVVQSGLLSHGICDDQNSLRWEDFANLSTPVPSFDVQERIANFLDERTARIDALIAEKERLLQTLTSFRYLCIRNEVLGLSIPNRKTGPILEPWLESLPAHWLCPKVKYVFSTTSGSTPSTDKRELYYNGDIPWIRTLDLNNGVIDAAEIFITEAALHDTACKLLPVGTILIAMYGGDGTIGKSGLLRMEATCNQALTALVPSEAISARYAHWYMLFKRPYWMTSADGTRKDPNISQDIIRNSYIPVPPLSEQIAIVGRLEQKISNLDALHSHVQRHINRLYEYRSSLISAAVTGQLNKKCKQEKQQ